MKKILLNVKMLSFYALIAGSFAISSCNQVKCNEPKDDNYESTTNNCDEAATSSKFHRSNKTMLINGSASNGTYLITIQDNSTPYTVDLITNWGLTGGIDPVSHTCSVNQNEATFGETSIGGGKVSGKITYNSGTGKVSIVVTFSGFSDTSINGTTNDTEQ